MLLLPDAGPLGRQAPRVPVSDIARRFWPYARPYRPYLALSFVLVALTPLLDGAQIWMFKLAIDDVLVPHDLRPLAWIAAVYIGLNLAAGLVSFAGDYLGAWIGERFLFSLRTSVFRHVQRLSLDFFDRRPLGDLVSRLTGDVAAIETFVLSGVTRALAYALEIAIFAGALFYLRWELALVILVIAPVALVATRHFSRLVKQASREKRRSSGSLSSVIEESLGGVQLVQAYNRQEHEVSRFQRENRASMDAELAAVRIKAVFAPVVSLLQVVSALLVLGIGTFEIERGRLTLGGLMVFLTFLARLYGPISGLSRLGNTVFAASAGAERIIELLDEQPTIVQRPSAKRLEWVDGVVDFDRVSFSYSGAARNALDDVSFRVEPGETLALVGRSGAGKSTIAKLLLRFYDPVDGSVRLDGVDVRELELESLRSNIALLLQDALVFDGTIRENIAFGRPRAKDHHVEYAAERAGLDELVRTLPDGYDTWIGQRGRRLSGGERQRIAIARAMIRDAPVLILDEPTTGLDALSAQRVLDPLRRLISGRTTIVISHNLLTVREATSILVLDRGRVAESGTHDELLACEGVYAELYRLHQPDPERARLFAVE